MMSWFEKNRDGIIVALVVGLLLEYGKKYLLIVVSFFSSLGVSSVDFIFDYIYVKSAMYSVAAVSNFLMHFSITVFCSCTFGFAALPILIEWREEKRMKKILVSPEKNNEDEVKKAEMEFYARSESNLKKSRIALVVLSFVLYVFTTITAVIPGMNYIQFEKNMTAIRPYIEETEYYQLQSKWVCMKNQADYAYIKAKIGEVKEKNGLGGYDRK